MDEWTGRGEMHNTYYTVYALLFPLLKEKTGISI